MARPFSVMTVRRRIWYADFIRLPPPLYHAGCVAVENARLSSALFPRLPPACVAASKSNSSAKSAVFQSRAAKKSHGHSAADDKDELRYRSPARHHEDSANSKPDSDSHAWEPQPVAPC